MNEKYQRTLVGEVVSHSMNKTFVLRVIRREIHPLYKKIVKKISQMCVHDEHNECHVGDMVKIAECRPISKKKAWSLIEVIRKAV